MTTRVVSSLAGRARSLSPRRRRWERFLRDLSLDPDKLPSLMAQPTERDFIICGCPRTGTTLLSGMLFQPPNCATVMEPWDGMRFPPAELFRSLRQEITDTGVLTRGRLDSDALIDEGQIRWCKEGESVAGFDADPDLLVGIKWTGFWRYLESLSSTKFLVCLRHPAEVINSFKKSGGRLAEGLDYDTAFNHKMNMHLSSATNDPVVRQVLMFDYIHARIVPHLSRPNVFPVRYERWFTDRSALLQEIGEFLDVELHKGYPRIRPPASTSQLSDRELKLLQSECHTLDALGYDLRRSVL